MSPTETETTSPLGARATFAGIIADMVLARCVEAGSTHTSRAALEASVPANERAYVRRAIDGLLDLGVLAAADDELGFTDDGNVFLAHVRRSEDDAPSREEPEDEVTRDVVLAPLLAAMAHDARLAPPRALHDLKTLPGRLENYRATARPRPWRLWTGIVVLFAAAAAAFVLTRPG